tara:strand:+ start:418 stop:819 length:402 start_codon:yes stop_codon:yes gene_type:complete
MKTIAKVTIKIADKPKFDVLIEMESASYKETKKITEILEMSGYKDFKIVNYIFLGVDKIIFESDKTPRAELKNRGYFVDNLWHIEDVQDRFECTDKEAMEVLDTVFSENSNTWEMIDIIGCDMGLKEKKYIKD